MSLLANGFQIAEIVELTIAREFHLSLAWDFMLGLTFIVGQGIPMETSIRRGVVRMPHGSVTS